MSESIYYPDSSGFFQSNECRAEFAKMDGGLTDIELVEFMTCGTVADLVDEFANNFVDKMFGESALKETYSSISELRNYKPKHSLGKIPVILDMKQELILAAARVRA